MHDHTDGSAKVKLAHYLEDGSKLEFETHVEATDYQDAVTQAEAGFKAAVAKVAEGAEPSMKKVKLEM